MSPPVLLAALTALAGGAALAVQGPGLLASRFT